MPFNVEKLISAASSGKHEIVAAQLDKWIDAKFPEPGPLTWLASIQDFKQRQKVAGMLAHVSATSGSHEVIEALLKSYDRAVLAGAMAPANNLGYTTAHLAAEFGHSKVIEALARSEDQAVKFTLTQRTGRRQMTPADLAADRGESSIIEALARAGGAALASLSEPNPIDHLKPQARAEARGCHGVVDVLKRVTPQVSVNLPVIPQAPSPLNYHTHLHDQRPRVPLLPLDRLPPLARPRSLVGGAQAGSFDEARDHSLKVLERRRQKHAASLDPQSKGKGPAGPGL